MKINQWSIRQKKKKLPGQSNNPNLIYSNEEKPIGVI